MRNLALMFVLFVQGCFFPDISGQWAKWGEQTDLVADLPLTYQICNFNTEDTKTIKSAIDWWNQLAGYEIFSQVECTGVQANIIVDNFLSVDNGDHIADTANYPCNDSKLCRGMFVSLFSKWNTYLSQYKEMILRHEFGHVLGLGHGFNQGCLMFFGLNRNSPAIDKLCQAEVESVCEHYPNFTICEEH